MSKVIDLFKKMQAKLMQEDADDQAIINKMDCWCVNPQGVNAVHWCS